MTQGRLAAALGSAAALALTAPFTAVVPAAAQTPQALELSAPRLAAKGTALPIKGTGAQPSERVRVEIRLRNGRWAQLAAARANRQGRFSRRVRPERPRRRIALRATTTVGAVSNVRTIRTRSILLAAVGDINLGNGPGAVVRSKARAHRALAVVRSKARAHRALAVVRSKARAHRALADPALRGLRFPWTSVAPSLRAADVAFGNLECAVSTRGAPVPKEFNFRGRPAALRVMARFAGFDVLNLANNHAGDYGTTALLDTVRYVRRFGMTPVGAGGSLSAAAKPRVVTKLGLRIAFVGFSNILPSSFFAGPGRAGTQPATPELIEAGVRAAKRRADVVIATFHWGVERATREDARQRAFADVALTAGADAVIGAHPHVLQPITRSGRRLVAYSLGNFVFGASSSLTARTGILRMKLSAQGVEGARLQPAVIEGTRPRLLGR